MKNFVLIIDQSEPLKWGLTDLLARFIDTVKQGNTQTSSHRLYDIDKLMQQLVAIEIQNSFAL